MPSADLLPEALKPFAYRNSVELTHVRWNSDVALLIEALRSYVTPKAPASAATIHATVPVQLPAPHRPGGNVVPAVKKNWKPALIGALAGIVLIVAIIAYFIFKHGPDNPNLLEDRAATAPNPNASAGTPAPAATAEYVGTWKRTGGAGDSDALGELVISNSGVGLVVHAYGRCQAAACDWGQQPGVLSGGNLIATFSPSPNGSDTSRTAMVTVHPTQGGLDVLVHNTFQNPAGSRANNSHHDFISAQ